MKHEIHTIWTLDQMRKIQIKNMKIIYNNKKHTDFNKKNSLKSFFVICFNWINKRKKSTIIFWHKSYKSEEDSEEDFYKTWHAWKFCLNFWYKKNTVTKLILLTDIMFQ